MTKRVWCIYAAVAALFIFWWFWVVDWIIVPGTYRVSVLYGACVIITASLHFYALKRFIRMVHAVRVEEHMGKIEPGATMFALNQRFRYAVRVIESLVVLVVAVVAFISVRDPKVAAFQWYIRLVITYFIGSILLTGVLTLRDLRVINWARKHDEELADRATVNTIHGRKSEGS